MIRGKKKMSANSLLILDEKTVPEPSRTPTPTKSIPAASSEESAKEEGASSSSSKIVPTFIKKAYEIFMNENNASSCEWNEEGDVIIITDPAIFARDVLPQHFKHKNPATFIRQLNMYGFRKTTVDPNIREFKHPHFLRGRKDLLIEIKRIPTKHHLTKEYDEHRENTDELLKNLKLMQEKGYQLEQRLKKVEKENETSRRNNELLWKHLEASNHVQARMKQKMQNILMFLYQLYIRKRGSPPVLQEEVSKETALMSTDEFSSPDFKNLLKFLSMENPELRIMSEPSNSVQKRKFEEISIESERKGSEDSLEELLQNFPVEEVPGGDLILHDFTALEEQEGEVLGKIEDLESSILTEYSDTDLNDLLSNVVSPNLPYLPE